MAWAEVGNGSQRASGHNLGNAGTLSITYPGNVTAGNLLVCVGVWWQANAQGGASGTLTGSDDVSTTYTSIVSDPIALGSGTYRVGLIYGLAGGSGANVLQFAPATTSYMSGSIDEFSGPHATPLDASTTTPNTGSSTDPTFSLTTVADDVLLIGIFGHGAGTVPTLSVDSPSIQFGKSETDDVDMAHAAGFRIISGAGGSYAMDWTSSASVAWATLVASFKPAAGGGGGSPGQVRGRSTRMLLGMGR